MARHAAAKDAESETVFTTKPSVVGQTGYPIPADRELVMPKKMAHVRYQRGLARPAAEVYLERLRRLGVVGITVTDEAEHTVAVAAKKVGVACNSGK